MTTRPAGIVPQGAVKRASSGGLIESFRHTASMSDWFPPDTPASSHNLDGTPDEPGPADPPLREGLPPTFRMRHDRHYVDELESRSPGVLVRMLRTSEIQVRAPVELDQAAPLVESVRRVGVLQPILVRPANDGYELIAGTRRVAAHRGSI